MCGRVKVVGLMCVCVCVCVCVSMLVSTWSHFKRHFHQWQTSSGSQTSVVASNKVYYCFDLLLNVSGPRIFQEVSKSDLGLSKVSEAFESTFG